MKLDRITAEAFFAEAFGRSVVVKSVMDGWCVDIEEARAGLSSFDPDVLTRLVFLAHDRAVRVKVATSNHPGKLRIFAFQRARDGDSVHGTHPTLDEALAEWRRRDQ